MTQAKSAGRVLIRPLGDYNPSTTYEMLDSVEYEGTSYLCKQTSTGNLPTNKTYWQKLVSIGGDFMLVDGTNADNVTFGGDNNLGYYFLQCDISKAVGEGEDVILTAIVPQANKNNVIVEKMLANQIGAEAQFVYSGQTMTIIIDSINSSAGTSDDTVTITAHLKTDRTDAISASNVSVYLLNHAGGHSSFIHGWGCNTDGYYNNIFGIHSGADGENNFVIGRGSFADGNHNVLIGQNNYGGSATYAFGRGLQANTGGQIVVGKYNNNKTASVFEVGGGNTITRKNILEIKDDGSFSQNDGVDFYKFAKLNGKDGFYDTAGNFHYLVPNYLEQQVTLSTSADTTVTFTNALITADSMLDVYTDAFGVNPTAMTATAGSATLTFAKAESAQTITVRLIIN